VLFSNNKIKLGTEVIFSSVESRCVDGCITAVHAFFFSLAEHEVLKSNCEVVHRLNRSTNSHISQVTPVKYVHKTTVEVTVVMKAIVLFVVTISAIFVTGICMVTGMHAKAHN